MCKQQTQQKPDAVGVAVEPKVRSAEEQQWLDELAKECHCCERCNGSAPCEGLMAGGFCDDVCFCGSETDEYNEYDDEQYTDEEWQEFLEESEKEELNELAANCKCGAWQFKNGNVIHVADCVCGAQ